MTRTKARTKRTIGSYAALIALTSALTFAVTMTACLFTRYSPTTTMWISMLVGFVSGTIARATGYLGQFHYED